MQELDYIKMGARIRQLRKINGWSQEELAKKCGISMTFMGHIERGTRRMSLDTFASMCMELQANADVLLWGSVQPSDSVMQKTWGETDVRENDSYSMYIRIMKSVADIMKSEGTERKSCEGIETVAVRKEQG